MKEINLVTVLYYVDQYAVININNNCIKARFNNDFVKLEVGTSFLAILEHRNDTIVITPIHDTKYQKITLNIIS